MRKDTRLCDVTQEVPWEDVPAFLSSRLREMFAFMETVKTQRKRNDENLLYFQCLRKGYELLQLFTETWGADLPIGCVATRSMLELDLLVRLFEAEPACRMKFYYSVIWDEKELWRAFLKHDASGVSLEALRQRLRDISDLERRHRISRDTHYIGRLNWHQLAQRFDVEQDYDMIYRWSSKILHITPFSVLRTGTVFNVPSEKDDAWRMLLLMIQVYSADVYERLARFTGLKIGEQAR